MKYFSNFVIFVSLTTVFICRHVLSRAYSFHLLRGHPSTQRIIWPGNRRQDAMQKTETVSEHFGIDLLTCQNWLFSGSTREIIQVLSFNAAITNSSYSRPF